MRPAVFLDRDGTLLEEAGYLDRLERLAFFPFAIDAVRLLNRGGYAVVIITNQSGVVAGMYAEQFVLRRARSRGRAGARPAADGSTATTTARIIRKPKSRDTAAIATAASRDPGCCVRRRASSTSTCCDRSPSATSGRTCRRVWPPARAASWCGPATDGPARRATKRPVEPVTIADDLIAATAWILRNG